MPKYSNRTVTFCVLENQGFTVDVASHEQWATLKNFWKDEGIKSAPDIMGICDRILENLPFGHKQYFWENSNENFSNFFRINIFAYFDKATIKPSCCEISHS